MSKHITLLILLFCFAGCNNRIFITGTVTYEEDGSPVKSGGINFEAGAGRFSGLVQDGKYRMDAGVPFGQYKIWLSGVQDVEYPADAVVNSVDYFARQKVIPLIANEYCSAAKTPLSFDVKSGGPKTYDIVVKKPAVKKKSKRK